MEWLNFIIIILSNLICLIWAAKKRHEITTTRIMINDDVGFTNEEHQQKYDQIFSDKDELEYVANTCDKVIRAMMSKFHLYMLIMSIIASILVYLFLEENFTTFSEPLLFFFGSYIQVLNAMFIFNRYSFFDPRVIFMNRASPKHALEFLIKVTSFITMSNQSFNLLFFCIAYIPSAYIFLGTDEKAMKHPTNYYEYFHRKFMCYGLGSVFALFITKSMSHLFCQGSRIAYEILDRDKGIPSDHPRNPARIINNISEGFWRQMQHTMEYNALTSMGLCLFQDFFVIKYVYVYNRGFLNGIAIYSIGMVGSLISMINFRYFSYFKFSQSRSFFTGVRTLRISGFKAIFISAILIILGSFLVLATTFPDSVAVYNPFRKDVAMRGIKYYHTFIIICFSFLINLSLVVNSIFFTDPLSTPNRSVESYTKISLSHSILDSELWSNLGVVLPMVVFLAVVIISYMYANVFGISINYLGCITFYQITQFFNNIKYLQNFYTTILMMNKETRNRMEVEKDVTFVNLNRTCTFYGKFSTGTSLFILQIMLFTILVDCSNMNIVKNLVVIEPYYIIAIFYGCSSLLLLSSLDLRLVDYFVQIIINRIREFVIERLEEKRFEPPVLEIATELVRVAFIRLLFYFILPVNSANSDYSWHGFDFLPLWRKDDQHCLVWLFPLGPSDLLSVPSEGRTPL